MGTMDWTSTMVEVHALQHIAVPSKNNKEETKFSASGAFDGGVAVRSGPTPTLDTVTPGRDSKRAT